MLVLGAATAAASANEIPLSCAVATDQAFGGDAFQAHLLPFRGHLLMVGDEVHDLEPHPVPVKSLARTPRNERPLV